MADVTAFKRRFTGSKKIMWSEDDVERLRKHYGVSREQADAVLKEIAWTPPPPPSLTKDAAPDLPTKWRFIASDGREDREHDVISVAGISLENYSANPIWLREHDMRQPIGVSAATEKSGGKLYSTLMLGVDAFPAARHVQKMLGAGMLRACSICFTPISWRPNQRGGIDFHAVDLVEISTVTIPCCPGATLIGPVKGLACDAVKRRRQRQLDLVRAKCA